MLQAQPTSDRTQVLQAALNRTTEPEKRISILHQLAELKVTDSLAFWKYMNEAMGLMPQADAAFLGAHKIRLAQYYLSSNQLTAGFQQVREALHQLASSSSVKAERTLGELTLGRLHMQQGRKDSAHYYFLQAYQRLTAGSQRELQAQITNYLATVLAELGRREEALPYYQQMLQLAEEQNDPALLGSAHNNLGKFLFEARQYPEARKELQKAIEVTRKHQDRMTWGKALVNLANVYITEQQYASGIARLQEADSVFRLIPFPRGLQAVNNNLGALYLRRARYDSAVVFLQRAHQIADSLKSYSGLALIQQNIGYAYIYLRNYPEAKRWFDRAEASALRYSDRYTLGEIYNHRSSYDSAVGDFRSAYFNKRLYTQIADSMYNAQLARQTGELQVKYETEKKERLILEQQYAISKRNYGLVAAIVLFALGGWLVWLQYRRYQQKQERRLQEERMQQKRLATRAVMEAEERERRRIASDLHDGIGQMMSAAKMNLSGLQSRLDFSDSTERENFDRIMALVDESCRELRTVSHNMMPNALLKAGLASAVQEFVDKLDSRMLQVNLYTEGLDQRLDAQVETVLYRIIQECVNNVIKHSGASLLDISLVREVDAIACTIEDNGQGFDVAAKQASGGGLGLKNLRARLDFLQGTMDIDSAPGKGTLVAMHIPLGGRVSDGRSGG